MSEIWQGGERELAVKERWIEPEILKRFIGPNTQAWAIATAKEWLIIFATIYVCNLFPNPLLWIAAIFLIGTRQHSLGILAHEGTHYLVSKNRYWNE